MIQKRKYDTEFKVQALKLSRETGFSKTAKELGTNILSTAGTKPQRGIVKNYDTT